MAALDLDGTAQRYPWLEAQLQATLSMIPAHTWYALPSGTLTFLNERCADYLGLPENHPLRFGIDTGASWDCHVPLLHSDDHEAALLLPLSPGLYTAVAQGVGGTTGVAIVEFYDVQPSANSRLANMSTRSSVQTGDNVMIGGMVIAGPDGNADRHCELRRTQRGFQSHSCRP